MHAIELHRTVDCVEGGGGDFVPQLGLVEAGLGYCLRENFAGHVGKRDVEIVRRFVELLDVRVKERLGLRPLDLQRRPMADGHDAVEVRAEHLGEEFVRGADQNELKWRIEILFARRLHIKIDCAGNDKLRTTSGFACLIVVTTDVMSRTSGANCSLATTLMSVPLSEAFT